MRFISDVKATSKLPDELFVDQSNGVEILANKTWKKVGVITDGIAYPNDDWVDDKGNLYVSNWKAGTHDIREYAPGAMSPTHTYSTDIRGPSGVTTDSKGNVYVVDHDAHAIIEYGQSKNTPIATCSLTPVEAPGLAVDSSGDVFAQYFTGSGTRIAEYKGGLAKCHRTRLGVLLDYGGGMVFDKQDNLIVCDEVAPAIYVLQPPYEKISGTFGAGWGEPVSVTINQSNTRAYVDDRSYAGGVPAIVVVTYPAGKVVATLSKNDGVSPQTGAVDGQNFVP
jgi:hypothetical protein